MKCKWSRYDLFQNNDLKFPCNKIKSYYYIIDFKKLDVKV